MDLTVFDSKRLSTKKISSFINYIIQNINIKAPAYHLSPALPLKAQQQLFLKKIIVGKWRTPNLRKSILGVFSPKQ